MRCRERSGFLFAHRCDHPVVGNCSSCNKPVCRHHSRMHDNQPLCISCYKKTVEPPPDPLARTRDRGYYSYYDDPYWYSAYHYSNYAYYDPSDQRVFDRGDAEDGAVATFEDDWDAS